MGRDLEGRKTGTAALGMTDRPNDRWEKSVTCLYPVSFCSGEQYALSGHRKEG